MVCSLAKQGNGQSVGIVPAWARRAYLARGWPVISAVPHLFRYGRKPCRVLSRRPHATRAGQKWQALKPKLQGRTEMKLLKRDRALLERILRQLEQAERFIMRQDVLICTRQKTATTTQDYVNKEGDVCCKTEKTYGSHLCQLFEATHNLRCGLGLTTNSPTTKEN